VQYNQAPQYNAPRGDRAGYQGGGWPDEVSDAIEDQSHVTIVNNYDIKHVNVHFHQQLVCIITHQTTI
jgi:hypothetical protein